jgi:hypothetical protein
MILDDRLNQTVSGTSPLQFVTHFIEFVFNSNTDPGLSGHEIENEAYQRRAIGEQIGMCKHPTSANIHPRPTTTR